MRKKNNKIYVTMTDKFMSGWGYSKNKNNKLVFVCDNMTEANIVYNNALNRGDMKYINIRMTKPYYNNSYNFVQFKTKDDYKSWYIENYF